MSRMPRKALFGLGFDCEDGHIRITKGKNFHLFGGSEKTHEKMQEKAVKFNEQLKKRNKSLDDINTKEFCEIAHAVGLRVPDDERKSG
ncbi:MAG: hypothetical protein ABIJ27_02435 [Candidatus Omnitrophota bacterium]